MNTLFKEERPNFAR